MNYLRGQVIDIIRKTQLDRVARIIGPFEFLATYRGLAVRADYSGQTFKHILLQIWLLTYQYGADTYRLTVNGFTGSIAGKYPKSG